MFLANLPEIISAIFIDQRGGSAIGGGTAIGNLLKATGIRLNGILARI
jgi:hypothetical protein